jgi:hypothetical protein
MTAHSSLQNPVSGTVTAADRAPAGGRGRLEVYAALGAWAGAIPLPWLPDVLVRSVRGALVHDIAVRHGVSLTPGAREVLANPASPHAKRRLLAQAVRFVGVKVAVQALTRFGPVGLVWPARVALGTFALGYLFDRYLEMGRSSSGARPVRIDEDEARRVRQAVDGAALRAFGTRPRPLDDPRAIDDQRDPATAIIDSLLSVAAGLPGRVLDHLDAAFDELLSNPNDE